MRGMAALICSKTGFDMLLENLFGAAVELLRSPLMRGTVKRNSQGVEIRGLVRPVQDHVNRTRTTKTLRRENDVAKFIYVCLLPHHQQASTRCPMLDM